MKKVLLASTALAMTAGMAAAEVTLSGYAEIGVADRGDGEWVFHDDFDVKFTLSGETDGGLQFGATIDLDEVGDDGNAPDGNGGDPIFSTGNNDRSVEEHSVFVSGDFGTITMGDTDGAFDWAMTEVWWGTTLTDDHTAYISGDLTVGANSGLDGIANGQIARYDYSFGDFAFALSAEIGDGTDGFEAYGIGGKYTLDFGGGSLGFGAAYQEGEGIITFGDLDDPSTPADQDSVSFGDAGTDADIWGLSLDASFGVFNARANYAEGEFDGNDVDYWGVGVAYISGPLLLEANYIAADFELGDISGYGLALNYDLGGGAVVMVGYGDSDLGDFGEDFDTFSAGLGLSF
jgi:outer membrane protein OmpU